MVLAFAAYFPVSTGLALTVVPVADFAELVVAVAEETRLVLRPHALLVGKLEA